MTALTRPARPEEDDAGLRPLPWRRMAGVTWRQHRIALGGMAALLGALAVWLWIVGRQLHHAYAAAAACHPASSATCQDLAGTFNGTWNLMGKGPAIFLQLLPALIGAFVGAPVLARELETGTFRFAWTQGFGRWRWRRWPSWRRSLVVLAAATAAVRLSCCPGRYQYRTSHADRQPGAPGALRGLPASFNRCSTPARGAFPAWTRRRLRGRRPFVRGMLIRRVVPAIAATLAGYAGLAFATAGLLREELPDTRWSPAARPTARHQHVAPPVSRGPRTAEFAFAGNPPLNLLNQFCVFLRSLPVGKGGGGDPCPPR